MNMTIGWIIVSVIVIVTIIVYFSVSGFSNKTYTKDEIIAAWTKTGCIKMLSEDILNFLIKLPKANADRAIKSYYVKIRSICGIEPNLTSFNNDQLNELKILWGTSKCPGAFPQQHLNNYPKNISFDAAKRRFTTYIKNLESNVINDDIPGLSLVSSYNVCYGDNWKSNPTLVEQYNAALEM